MPPSKVNKIQDIEQNVFNNIIFKVSQSSVFQQRKEIMKILCSAINVCSNVFFLTRIRLPQIGNFCYAEDYDFKYGCNSVFKSLIDFADRNTIGNDNNNNLLSNLNQEQVLSFSEQQVITDKQSFLNVMQYIAPLYLLIFLVSNISELASKKQKIDIFVFILVLIALADLMFFNATYTFSLIKPNILDSKIFNANFNLFTKSQVRDHNQNTLLLAQNNIFYQTSRFFIAFSLITKVIAIYITSYQFSQQILAIQSISIFQKKLMKYWKKTIVFQQLQKFKQYAQNIKHSQQNYFSSVINYYKTLINKSILKNTTNVSENKCQSSELIECVNTSISVKMKSNMLEQIKDKKNNVLINQIESNKKSKSVNKKQYKSKFQQNTKENIQNQNTQQEDESYQFNSTQNLQQLEENQQNISKELQIVQEDDDLQRNKKNDQVDLQQNINNNQKELELLIFENNGNQKQQIIQQFIHKPSVDIILDQQLTSIKSLIQEVETNQFSFEFQKLNLQNSQDSDNLSRIQKIKIFEDSDKVEEGIIQKSYHCTTKQENSSHLFNNQCKETQIIDEVLETIQNNSLSLSLQSHSQRSPIQSSNETFFLNESDQMTLDNQNNNRENELSPKQLSPIYPCKVTNLQELKQQEKRENSKQNISPNHNTEQLVIEQPNDDIRKKWQQKQKALKLEKMNLVSENNHQAHSNQINTTISTQNDTNNSQNYQINNINNTNNSINTIGHNQSLLSASDCNSICPQGNSNLQNYSSINDQVIFQEDLDVSTNDESNFTSINSNYDGSSITKQIRNDNSMNLKNLSQHLLNQQVASVLAQQREQRGNYQVDSKIQQINYHSSIDSQTDPSSQFQNFKNAQYQEEQCYNNDLTTRTNNSQANVLAIQDILDQQNLYFEDDCQKTAQKCFKQFIHQNQQNKQYYLNQQNSKLNILNCPLKQQNAEYGFNHEVNDYSQIEDKTPFELFYDKQCLMDEEYDEEEELDKFQENTDEDESDDEDDEDESDEEDDEDEDDEEDEDDDEEEDEYSLQANKIRLNFENKMKQNINIQGKSFNELIEMGFKQEQIKNLLNNNTVSYLEGNENYSDTSVFLQSQLHQTTETFSIDELKSHLGDYLDLINDENSLNQQIIYELNCKKSDLSQLSSCQDFGFEQQDNFGDDDDGKKKRKKKKKSKEQKKKRRQKRKMKRRLDRDMIESGLDGSIQQINPYSQDQREININLCNVMKKNIKRRKKTNKNKKKYKIYKNSNNLNVQQNLNESSLSFNFNYSGCNRLKKFLDENLLEYFTFSVVLSQGYTVNIYITDFYQFDEQFEMQSRTYGIDENMILDSKINIIFDIMQQNLYPAMNPFFEHLIQSYSTSKIAYFQQQLTQQLLSEYLNTNSQNYAFQETKNEEQNTYEVQSQQLIQNESNQGVNEYLNIENPQPLIF